MNGLMSSVCSQCGEALPEGAAFCPRDGTRVGNTQPFGENQTFVRPRSGSLPAAPGSGPVPTAPRSGPVPAAPRSGPVTAAPRSGPGAPDPQTGPGSEEPGQAW